MRQEVYKIKGRPSRIIIKHELIVLREVHA